MASDLGAPDVRNVGASRRGDVMVLLDVVGLLACLVAIIWRRADLGGEAVTLLSTIATYFGLSLRDAHQYEFGSSRGSRVKDGDNADVMQQLLARVPPAAPIDAPAPPAEQDTQRRTS